MTAKLNKKDKKKSNINIDDLINNIKEQVDKLKNIENIDTMISQRNIIQSNIVTATQNIEDYKILLNSDSKQNDAQDEFDFNKWYEEIDNLYNHFWDDNCSINEQINKYHIMKIKIDECLKFLESKEMEVSIIQ